MIETLYWKNNTLYLLDQTKLPHTIEYVECNNYKETIDAIKARETYDTEDWLIIITSDHGGFGTKHGKASIQERMTFIVSNKEFLYE